MMQSLMPRSGSYVFVALEDMDMLLGDTGHVLGDTGHVLGDTRHVVRGHGTCC